MKIAYIDVSFDGLPCIRFRNDVVAHFCYSSGHLIGVFEEIQYKASVRLANSGEI